MKFEKFLKSVGTHGIVIARNEREKWLVCNGVGMVIPYGVDNLLGSNYDAKNIATIVDIIANEAECDEILKLDRAVIMKPDGKANDIYRVFVSDIGAEIGIFNADYGLLERKDILSYFEIEIDADENGNKLDEDKIETVKYMLVYNESGDIIGFITGSARF